MHHGMLVKCFFQAQQLLHHMQCKQTGKQQEHTGNHAMEDSTTAFFPMEFVKDKRIRQTLLWSRGNTPRCDYVVY